ncbi:hypothetical protein TUM17387_22630 [Shewanella carassii]|uniref:CC0125/CC1285 family lipoprotein n=1 Tax=Shewanella carassii TaxID=1987584 RepID=UPI001BEF105E|nr:hypothetical protein [Shewanella carassii]BCV66904.1 hypothetical protein TUM17387_22630 [Shewanella carassii]
MKSYLGVIFALTLVGCATPYQSVGTTGGLSYSQFDEKVFEVSFSGNIYTSVDQARDFVKLKGAELCLESGYSFYNVLRSEAHSSSVIKEPSGLTWETSMPSAKLKLECVNSKQPDARSFDAQIVSSEMKSKYNL